MEIEDTFRKYNSDGYTQGYRKNIKYQNRDYWKDDQRNDFAASRLLLRKTTDLFYK